MPFPDDGVQPDDLLGSLNGDPSSEGLATEVGCLWPPDADRTGDDWILHHPELAARRRNRAALVLTLSA